MTAATHSAAQIAQAAQYEPRKATHRGPHGLVRAREWTGQPADHHHVNAFIWSGGSVSYRTDPPRMAIVIDTERDGEQTARPGDWLVWDRGQLIAVEAARFAATYQPIGGRP